MKPQLRILSGARAGHTEVFSKPSIQLGRHATADLRFHAERDLDVSARHATLLKKGEKWFVRDAGSRNGTYVNGHRISADVRLEDTDQIQCGANGPKVEIRLVPDHTADGVIAEATVHLEVPQGPGMRETAAQTPRPSVTQRIRVEVSRQTRLLRTVIIALSVALVCVVAGLWYAGNQREQARQAEIAASQARTDSILRAADAAVRALQGQVEGLAARLRESQGAVTRLQQELTAAQQSGRTEDAVAIRRQLAAATTSLRYQQAAAQVDYSGISARNQQAVALLWVEYGPGEVFTGTAFAVRADGMLLTNRHVVAGEDGTRRPTRIALRFADSDQTWRARLVAVSQDADLAVLKVDIRGGVPTIQGFNDQSDAVRQGDPVAIIGYPLGTDLPMTGAVARTSLFAGSVSKMLSDVVQIDGYGASGASGSPIFDRNGDVVAILYGGQAESSGRIVYGVPAHFAVELLARVP